MPDPLAIYGALLSTVLLGWTIYQGRKDHGWLRIELHVDRTTIGESTVTKAVILRATNTGRRPISIVAVGVKCKGKRQPVALVVSDAREMPKLDESESRDAILPLGPIGPASQVEWFMMTDSYGRIFRTGRRETRALLKRYPW